MRLGVVDRIYHGFQRSIFDALIKPRPKRGGLTTNPGSQHIILGRGLCVGRARRPGAVASKNAFRMEYRLPDGWLRVFQIPGWSLNCPGRDVLTFNIHDDFRIFT